MNLRERLKHPPTLKYAEVLASEIYQMPDLVQEVFELIFDEDMDVAWRAAWTVEKIQEHDASLFSLNHWERLTGCILSTSHSGLLRGCLSIMMQIEIPGSVSVPFINWCFQSMVSPNRPVAVQALSMKMLLRICDVEPAFIPELRVTLEHCDTSFYSPGFISTRKLVLRKLRNR